MKVFLTFAVLAAVVLLSRAQDGNAEEIMRVVENPFSFPSCGAFCQANCGVLRMFFRGNISLTTYGVASLAIGQCNRLCQTQLLCPCMNQCFDNCAEMTRKCRDAQSPLGHFLCEGDDFLCRGSCSTRCNNEMAIVGYSGAIAQIESLNRQLNPQVQQE